MVDDEELRVGYERGIQACLYTVAGSIGFLILSSDGCNHACESVLPGSFGYAVRESQAVIRTIGFGGLAATLIGGYYGLNWIMEKQEENRRKRNS